MMKLTLFSIVIIVFISCAMQTKDKKNMENIQVLEYLDKGVGSFFSDFLVLEDGYNALISVKAHLYLHESKWAIVFEKSSYQNQNLNVQLELTYFGNCLKNCPEGGSNKIYFVLCEENEIKKLYRDDSFENFELISEDSGKDSIKMANRNVYVEYDKNEYLKNNIEIRNYNNPDSLVDIVSCFRYIHEKNNEIFNATEVQLRTHVPNDLPLLMTIDSWYHEDLVLPSKLESYRMMSEVLEKNDPSIWKVTKTNTSWRNWLNSGDL